jgi:Ribbon-helix-helix protein, copG family
MPAGGAENNNDRRVTQLLPGIPNSPSPVFIAIPNGMLLCLTKYYWLHKMGPATMDKMQPKKRGRPATGIGIPVQVRLQSDLLKIIDASCKATGQTRQAFIRKMLHEWAEGSDFLDPEAGETSRPVLIPFEEKQLEEMLELCRVRYGYRIERGLALREMLEEFMSLYHTGVVPANAAD